MKHVFISGVSALCLAASGALAHPHIFVDTGLRLIHDDQGRLAALEITWTYDEFFSLLLLENLELDADFDGVLTPAEEEKLQGFDMQWTSGFEGDVYLNVDGAPLGLGAPQPGPAVLNGKGQLVSVHRRDLARPVDASKEAVQVRAYDPTFYTAYSIPVDQVSTDGPGCEVAVYAPDLDEAYAQLDSALNELMGQADFNQEMDFPPVGDRFAEEVRLTCQGGS